MNTLSLIADITGIISFIIGLGTFITTLKLRKKIVSHVEKSDYYEEVEAQSKNLLSYCDTINKDNVYNTDLLDMIDITLDDLVIAYGSILPKDLLSQIKKVRNHIKNKCQKSTNDKEARRECVKQLHRIAVRLLKEKKVLW